MQSARDQIDITAVSRFKHGDLYAAAKKLGSQAALARKIGVRNDVVGRWINLQCCPPLKPNSRRGWPEERHQKLELDLYNVTGKLLEELFPVALSSNKAFLASPKTRETTRTMSSDHMLEYVRETHDARAAQIEHFTDAIDLKELGNAMRQQINKLSPRHRKALQMRFGIGCKQQGFREIGKEFKVSKQQAGHIVANAIRQMQAPDIASRLVDFEDIA